MRWCLSIVCALMSMAFLVPSSAQIAATFDPPVVNPGVGESVLIAIRVSGVPANGLAAFQVRLTTDQSVAEVLDPNRSFPALVPAFAPLGNDANCATVRGQACTDPSWMLSQSGRVPVSGLPDQLPADSDVYMVYGTSGAAAPVSGDGAIALIEVTGVAEGSTAVSIADLILASGDEPPVSHSVILSDLQVNVGAVVDTDGDGVVDSLDNCIEISNASQVDSNGDGYGNACDLDLNNDNIINFLDLGPLVDAFFSTPEDANWNPDADTNNDGAINFLDFALFQMMFLQPPGPSGVASRPGRAQGSLTWESPAQAVSHVPLVNEAPIVWLADALHAVAGAAVYPDASRSFDVRGDRLSFEWDVIDGPFATKAAAQALSRRTSPVAQFIAPEPGTYVLRCRVTDGTHVSESRVTVSAHSLSAPLNALINARNSWSTSTRVRSKVYLDTSLSSDADSTDVHDQWRVRRRGVQPVSTRLSGSGAQVVVLSDDSAFFIASETGDYEVNLERATDAGSDRAAVAIRVDPGEAVPALRLSATMTSSGAIELGSYGAPMLRQQWRLVSRPESSRITNTSINRSTSEAAGFIPDVPGPYILRLDYVSAAGAGFEQIFIDTGVFQ